MVNNSCSRITLFLAPLLFYISYARLCNKQPQGHGVSVKRSPWAVANRAQASKVIQAQTETRFHPRFLEEEGETSALLCDLLPQSNLDNAWDVAYSSRGTGMLVYQNGVLRFEQYAPENVCLFFCRFAFVRTVLVDWLGLFNRRGGAPARPAALYSMTKTLAGLAALLLQRDGVSLDDPVSLYITEWANDTERNAISIRQLLSLSSGMEANVGWMGHLLFQLSNALTRPILPAQPFDYGWEPFLAFSRLIEVVTGKDAETFLQEQLFTPLGITSFQFGQTARGDPLTVLSSSASATLPDVAALGLELLAAAANDSTRTRVLTHAEIVGDLLRPGSNPAYGLTVWLNAAGLDTDSRTSVEVYYPACGSSGVIHAIGAGGQILTIVPSQQLVVAKTARLAGRVRFEDMKPFWEALFENQDCTCRRGQEDV